MKNLSLFLVCLVSLFLGACATQQHRMGQALHDRPVEKGSVIREFALAPGLQEKILSLDPENVGENDVSEVLAKAPAPRIINIHGGIYPVHLAMKSFSHFLIGMGYPETKIRSPRDGDYSYSCYESSEKLAGMLAWYYEREGLRPMIIGHSQGGIQTVKVLHELAGHFSEELHVWNPVTEEQEERLTIIDPFTGDERPVVSLQVSYATAVGSGGLTRFLPNQWSMLARLRKVPDSVVEFTGFYMGLDIIGGDLMGFGSVNKYEPNGKAHVRNVQLPTGYNHVTVPVTRHLAESREIKDWINTYVPTEQPELNATFEDSSTNILWAADVWHSIKKHWVLELRRMILAKRAS